MSRHRDVLEMLSEARPGQLDRGPRPLDLNAITAYPRDTTRRRRRRRLLVAGGLIPAVAAGALAVSAVVVRLDAPPPASTATGREASPPATAQQLLLTAADRVALERVADEKAIAGRYWVIKTEQGATRQVGPAGRPYDILQKISQESWLAWTPKDQSRFFFQGLGAAPATPADTAAWKRDGSPAKWTQPAPRGMKPVVITAASGPRRLKTTRGTGFVLGGRRVSAAELSTLPADPARLKAYLLKQDTTTGETQTEYLFWSANLLVLDMPVTPEVRAAAYRMMAGLKGVTTLGQVTDQQGRKGVAVAYTRRGDAGTLGQVRLIFDPRTGQAFAREFWNLGKSASGQGKLTSYTLVTSAAWSSATPPEK
ncbi:hypothetical protein Pth03_10350 [Planotetraspora thailandica]|uniref:CU044_5270 family protein n=1 Tax=Planotetraspora thailandica TaxID=487172 RepID=A0A8J3UXH4_9ACTN|nr:CU044_5270 family protein [Planotetraspora thailandica]GII52646.1 hypothetical protein Pth03_10350 [Planotetraspora thailandica]